MLSNLVIALEAVLPMFIIMAIGLLVRKKNILTETEVRRLNRMIFLVFFPVLMFTNLYGADVNEAFDLKLVVFSVLGVLTVYGLTVIFILTIEKSPKKRGAMIQAIYRSNFVIMGIPVVQNIFGGEHLAIPSLMVTIIVPLFNVLAVITLEIFRGGKIRPLSILLGIAKNPLIIGAVLGILSVLLQIQLPGVLEQTVKNMSAVATPMALLLLGASFDVRTVSKELREIIICVAGRLVAVPALGMTVSILFGFRGVALVTLLVIFASPTAVSSFTMAQQMDSDGELAGNAVIFSSMFSGLTLFLWIFLLKTLGLF